MRTLAIAVLFLGLTVQVASAQSMDHGRQERHEGHAPAEQEAPQSALTGTDRHADHDNMSEREDDAPDEDHDMSEEEANAPAEGPPADHEMPSTSADDDPHAGHDMSTMDDKPSSEMPKNADETGRPPETPPPAAARTGPRHAADSVFGADEMADSREQLRAEQGGMKVATFMAERLEVGASDDSEGYLWDLQGWYGGDINRFWWKSEGEGEFGEEAEGAELQALYSRAMTPFFDLQAGVRYDIRPEPERAHLVLGVQGLAPYWFEVDAAAFLSDEGEVTGRIEAEYDQRITQRLILQPRAELNLSAEDIPELGIGAGASSIEAGVRLRYEIRREFAPYIGIEWEGRFGQTKDFARAVGEDSDETRVVIGIRSWF